MNENENISKLINGIMTKLLKETRGVIKKKTLGNPLIIYCGIKHNGQYIIHTQIHKIHKL